MKKFQIIGTRGRLSSLLGRTSTSSCLTRKGMCLWCSVSISAEASGGRGSNVTFSSVGSWILGYQNLQNLPKHHAKNGLQTSIVWLKMLSATKQLSPQIKFLKCVEYLSHNRSLWLFVTTVILMARAATPAPSPYTLSLNPHTLLLKVAPLLLSPYRWVNKVPGKWNFTEVRQLVGDLN